MARPVYILCSESGSEDKITGLVSHFNVIDKVEVREITVDGSTDGAHAVGLFRLYVVAVWAADPQGEPERDYEFENCLYLPPDGRKATANEGVFRFNMFRHRFTVTANGIPLREGGVLRAESRIRPEGNEEWLVQGYDIPVIGVPNEPPAKDGS